MFYIGLYWEQHEKIFLSETTRPRALIFDSPGAKNGPARGVTCFTLAYIGSNMKISSCLKPQGLEPQSLVCSII